MANGTNQQLGERPPISLGTATAWMAVLLVAIAVPTLVLTQVGPGAAKRGPATRRDRRSAR